MPIYLLIFGIIGITSITLLGSWYARKFNKSELLIALYVTFVLSAQILAVKISEFNFGDLFCRLENSTLLPLLQKTWKAGTDDALIQMQVPHPRHDIFLQDLGYVRGFLPESFLNLEWLGIRFEIAEVAYMLDSHWQKSVDDGSVTYEDIQLISKQALNVIQWVTITLKIKKSLWKKSDSPILTPEMKKQLMEQLQGHIDRGDQQAANVLRQFLNQQGS